MDGCQVPVMNADLSDGRLPSVAKPMELIFSRPMDSI